eukprot:455367_1
MDVSFVLRSFAFITLVISTTVVDESSSIQRQPINGYSIGTMDILDTVSIEFDIEIHSFPSINSFPGDNIIHIGNIASERFPVIYLSANSFVFQFSPVVNNNAFWQLSTATPLEISTQYHVLFTANHETLHMEVTPGSNNIANIQTSSHSIAMNRFIWISSPWIQPANVTISTLTISTTNNNFNYLCDYHHRFTDNNNGNWYNTSNSSCSITQSNGADIDIYTWLGEKDPISKEWNEYIVETVIIPHWNDTSNSNEHSYIGIFAQQQSSDTYYKYTMEKQPDYVQQNTWLSCGFVNHSIMSQGNEIQANVGFDKSVGFTLKMKVKGSSVKVYLNGKLYLNGTGINSGSIALYTRNTPATYTSLTITFQTDGLKTSFTYPPTSIPDPTLAPLTPQPTTNIPTSNSVTDSPTTNVPTTKHPTLNPNTASTTGQPSTKIQSTAAVIIENGDHVKMNISVNDDVLNTTEVKTNIGKLITIYFYPLQPDTFYTIEEDTITVNVLIQNSNNTKYVLSEFKDTIQSQLDDVYGEGNVVINYIIVDHEIITSTSLPIYVQIQTHNLYFQQIYIALIFVFSFIIISSYLDANYIRQNDFR